MAKIAIIGGGFTGLSAAYRLKDHEVTIFESSDKLGGLASGIKMPDWDWYLDKLVHHCFTSDKWARSLAKQVGIKEIIRNPRSSCFFKGKFADLDSPQAVLKFPFLSFFERIRLGISVAYLKLTRDWTNLETKTAYAFLNKLMGKEVFRIVWEPLFLGKFGKYAHEVNAAWFWARIHSRTKNLIYFDGGFQMFADAIGNSIIKNKGSIILNTKIDVIKRLGNCFVVHAGKKRYKFDKIILATSLQSSFKIFDFPLEYRKRYGGLKSIGAQYLALELKEQLLKDIYWLNINDVDFPFMMIAEHTNFIDKRYYNNKHLIWVGKYLDYENPLWNLSEKELLDSIIPYLKRINPKFDKSWISRTFFSRVSNAQPIMPVNYSRKIPSIKTPIAGLYLASMNNVYPWDRGVNYAVELGNNVAKIINSEESLSSS